MNNLISVAFFGTHTFAVSILKALLEMPEHLEVTQIITQPDKPVGRKKVLTPSPVKTFAENNTNISILQPTSLKGFTEINNVDLIVVAQYGKIIPQHILDIPHFGVVNTHTSLLPKYRGASPIQTALVEGEKTTGVTLMLMDKNMDTGPIFAQESLDILPSETYLELDARLAKLSADAMKKYLPLYLSQNIKAVPQNNEEATYCALLSRADGRIDWQKDATDIYNQYRGLTPWPGIWTMWKDKRVKLQAISCTNKEGEAGRVYTEHNQLYIGTESTQSILVESIQVEGKSVMSSKEFISGYKQSIKEGIMLA